MQTQTHSKQDLVCLKIYANQHKMQSNSSLCSAIIKMICMPCIFLVTQIKAAGNATIYTTALSRWMLAQVSMDLLPACVHWEVLFVLSIHESQIRLAEVAGHFSLLPLLWMLQTDADNVVHEVKPFN